MAIKVQILVVLLYLISYPLGAQIVDQGEENVISEEGKVLLAPDEDDNCIGRMGEKFWDTVKWYFANAGLVIVSGIYGDEEEHKLDSATNHFINFFHSVPTLTMFFKFYTKRGFKLIPNSKIIGVLVVAEDLNSLEMFFEYTPSDLVESSKSHFFFIILNQALQNATEEFATNLWMHHNILNLMIMMPCGKEAEQLDDLSGMIGFLDPFVARRDSWGEMKWMQINELNHQPDEDSDLWHGDGNFHGYPIKFEVFVKYPTLILDKEIPQSFATSYIQRNAKIPNNLAGLDAIIMGNLAQKLNFTIALSILNKMDFGYEMGNGTITGVLGDVAYKVTDITFNNRFIMPYRGDFEFLYPFMADQFCLLTPKAQLKPKWMAIFQCFSIEVWFMLVIITLICGFVRYMIKRWAVAMATSAEDKQALCTILFETWNAMMSAPSILFPNRTVDRFFLAICLLMNVIITGTFQGSLSTSITTPSSYKDMNTLEELDESQLLIYMQSEQFMDVFGDGGTTILDSLRRKLRMMDKAEAENAENINVAKIPVFISRKLDSTLNIEREYTWPDGSPMYHVMKECPRNYHISYVVRGGWAFSTFFSTILSHLREAGFIDLWYRSTANAIIMHRKITVDRPENPLKPFNLEDMQTAFFILALGLTACTFVFAVELIWKRRIN